MPRAFFGTATVLGIGVAFESNSEEALNAALASIPNRNPLEASLPATSVYIVLKAQRAGRAPPDVNRISGKRLEIIRDGIALQADGERGGASCVFPVDATGSAVFREAVNTMVLFLVAQAGRVPIHASAVVIGDCAYVLAGQSGSGKSLLALAADRIGLPVLAEDTVFVQLAPSFRVWGLAHHIHILEKDAPWDVPAHTRFRSGRLKRAFEIRKAQAWSDKAALCVLARGRRVSIDPLAPKSAVRRLTSDPESGYQFYGARMKEATRAIVAAGSWTLTLSENPDAAIAALIDEFGQSCSRKQVS